MPPAEPPESQVVFSTSNCTAGIELFTIIQTMPPEKRMLAFVTALRNFPAYTKSSWTRPEFERHLVNIHILAGSLSQSKEKFMESPDNRVLMEIFQWRVRVAYAVQGLASREVATIWADVPFDEDAPEEFKENTPEEFKENTPEESKEKAPVSYLVIPVESKSAKGRNGEKAYLAVLRPESESESPRRWLTTYALAKTASLAPAVTLQGRDTARSVYSAPRLPDRFLGAPHAIIAGQWRDLRPGFEDLAYARSAHSKQPDDIPSLFDEARRPLANTAARSVLATAMTAIEKREELQSLLRQMISIVAQSGSTSSLDIMRDFYFSIFHPEARNFRVQSLELLSSLISQLEAETTPLGSMNTSP